jgi:hypothetical protein
MTKSVEVLVSYSHSTPPADLQRCADAPRSSVVPADTSATKRPWSVQDRIDERTRADMIAAYRAGTTAASLATTHGLSLRSVKRLLTSAGVRRKQLPA